MRSPTAMRVVLAGLLALTGLAMPAVAAAHPLGNFTINHYAALRVSSGAIALDVVVDFAEIPAFQERIRIDSNADGDVGETEATAARAGECEALMPSLKLELAGSQLPLSLRAAGIQFPAGAGGVPTMRVVCELEATSSTPLADGRTVTFADASFAERIGWREIVVLGDEVAIEPAAGGAPPSSADVSARLSSYPAGLLAQPLDVRSAAFTVAAGGADLPPFVAPDATSLDAAGPSPSAAPGSTAPPAAAVPGGVGGDIPDLFRVADLTPILALASILLAAALGAGHALTPGHGKTLMAAYLVGTRGTIRHAAGLGLAVTVSHTIGILALALLVTGAESLLPADVVVRTVPVIAALAFVAIGASMLFAEARRRYRGARLVAAAHAHGLTADTGAHEDGHDHAGEHQHEHAAKHAAEHAHEHAREHDRAGEHSHGSVRHSHLPADDRTLSWKNLFALGLAGGIIPSANALIILLGTIVAGRAAFGVVLVIAFGLGMALVLAGVGALMVVARERLERMPAASGLGRIASQAPLAASIAVLGIGLWLTAQALGGGTVL